MNQKLYQKYVSLKEQGKKTEAQDTVHRFVASFESFDEKRQWVRDFLESHQEKERIPHEMYRELVFPVLLEGYQRSDAWSIMGIVKTIQNVYRAEALYASIGYKSDFDLLKEAYALEPLPEIRQRLLLAEVKWFEYSQHEYPTGILYGINGATPDQCAEILQEIGFARSLDQENAFAAFLQSYEQKVLEYQTRLRSKSSHAPKA